MMPFGEDAFRHVPGLWAMVTAPDTSNMRLSYARFEELDAQAEVENWPLGWRLSHEAREANRREVLQDRLSSDLWVFAYGSLIWDPAVHIDEVRRASLTGWSRRFCMRIDGGRGTVDQPGLMAALETGGTCQGVAVRIPADLVARETEFLWMREMFSGAYVPTFVPVETPQGTIEALAFVMDTENERYSPRLSLDQSAAIIAKAEGSIGRNFDYLDSLICHLGELGIKDAPLVALHKRTLEFRSVEGSEPTGI
jgi:cation transport protein ChaC